MMNTKKPRLFFLASGQGGLFKSCAEALKKEIQCEIVGLGSQNGTSGGVSKAKEMGIPIYIYPKSSSALNEELLKSVELAQPDLIILAGFSRKIPEEIVKAYSSRMVNSHPSLLPKYGGQGMYGSFVHQAVFRAKELETGITVHLINEEYDQGKILAQKTISISAATSAAEIEDLVKNIERHFYPEVLVRYLLSMGASPFAD
ncbi:MAG: hypothetical protein KDD22_07575 [Bdellovibrionales bacterium]|nr:hypothetical protein [Bdellovibrionales bacterium]